MPDLHDHDWNRRDHICPLPSLEVIYINISYTMWLWTHGPLQMQESRECPWFGIPLQEQIYYEREAHIMSKNLVIFIFFSLIIKLQLESN